LIRSFFWQEGLGSKVPALPQPPLPPAGAIHTKVPSNK
jgi:hypothetical protein